jgi:hypothetical protein
LSRNGRLFLRSDPAPVRIGGPVPIKRSDFDRVVEASYSGPEASAAGGLRVTCDRLSCPPPVQLARYSFDRHSIKQAHHAPAFVQETIDLDKVALLVRRPGFNVEFVYAGLTLLRERER